MDDFNSWIPSGNYQDHDPAAFFFQEPAIPTTAQFSTDPAIFQDLPNYGSFNSFMFSPHGESSAADEVATTTATAAAAATSKKGKRLRKQSNVIQDIMDNGDPAGDNEKRALHRNIERQRRQEMANLFASLRTLLPLEFIKGKRSVTDQLHQATGYIKHMEDKIGELEVKRNMLMRNLSGESNNNNIVDVHPSSSEARRLSCNVGFSVRSCSGSNGIEILMNSDLADDWFPLSRVLNVLQNEGLTVVNCTYTKVDDKFHCTIQTDDDDQLGACQVTEDYTCSLQEKLEANIRDWKKLGPR